MTLGWGVSVPRIRADCWAALAPERRRVRPNFSEGQLVKSDIEIARAASKQPIWDVGASLERGDLVRVLPGYEQPADVWAIYPSRLSTSARVRVCVEFLEEWLRSQ